MARYAAFISYSSRYREWVKVLHQNLELCLAKEGKKHEIFLDQIDLGPGRSWVTQLQAGLDRADQIVLVVTPEAMASPRVKNEWESLIATARHWEGRLQLAVLVETPLPPFLEAIQFVDFREHDEARYRSALSELVAGLLGQRDRRSLPELPNGVTVPDPPKSVLPARVRKELVDWLGAKLEGDVTRWAAAGCLGLGVPELEAHPSWACAASAAVVQATGDDHACAAALRMVEALTRAFKAEDDGTLERLAEELERLTEDGGEAGLLGAWLDKIASDHERLVPYFQQSSELTLLDRVYVQLQLSTERRRALPGGKGELALEARGPWSLRDLLALDPEDHAWISRRWIILGDPGAGKTTLLRHLAAGVARERPGRWVPIFESLARLMREPEWLLDRLERQMKRAGAAAESLASVLDREGQDGRLLLLLDGLDEVPQERREEAEALLRQLSSRWPQTPLIVTSRPIGYRRPASDFRELDLLPFGPAERREFLARWFGRERGKPDTEGAERAAEALERDAGLRDLASNPLYLTLMALLIEQGTSPERNRPRLYDQVFKLLLKGEHRNPSTPMERPAAVRRMLRHLGYTMTEDGADAEPLDVLEDRLYRPEADKVREELERVARWRPRLSVFLEELSNSSGILGPHDGPHADWRYWHRTFREALAAEALQEKLESQGGRKAVLAHASALGEHDLSRWAEPYALLTGWAKDPDDLVKALAKENRPLGLRALATADGLEDKTLNEILELSEDWQERAKVYERLPELIDEPARALRLIDRLRRRATGRVTRNPTSARSAGTTPTRRDGRTASAASRPTLGIFMTSTATSSSGRSRGGATTIPGARAVWRSTPRPSSCRGRPAPASIAAAASGSMLRTLAPLTAAGSILAGRSWIAAFVCCCRPPERPRA